MLTASSREAHFPGLIDLAYLNTAAEGIPPLSMAAALQRYAEHKSRGMAGREPLMEELAACQEDVARFLKRSAEEVAFCSCSSEAYNLLASALSLAPEEEVVLTDLDFPSGATPWLVGDKVPVVHLWEHREGVLQVADLVPLLSSKTRLVQVSLVSFLTGHRVDWPKLRDCVRTLAPQAIISVDVTQAFGRVELDCLDADVLIASTYKWLLGSHGGAVVSISSKRWEQVTAQAGGWFHIENAFEADRFQRAVPKSGVASFANGMPNFPAIYCLREGLRVIQEVGVEAIAAHANPLVEKVHEVLNSCGLKPMSPWNAKNPSGIVSFLHPKATELDEYLRSDGVEIMHQAGRLRVSIHGYNTMDDVDRFARSLRSWMAS